MSKKKETRKKAVHKKELQNTDMNAAEVQNTSVPSDTEAKFEIKYKETQDVLEKICMTYNADKVSINCRLFAVIAVPFITGHFSVKSTCDLGGCLFCGRNFWQNIWKENRRAVFSGRWRRDV